MKAKWNRFFLTRRLSIASTRWLNRVALRASVLAMALTANGVLAQQSPSDLASKSLEELMNIEVTSVSKKQERLFQTAAAIYVITQEDIRRSGMTSLPELLRMVPGLSVARIDGNKYAISARGFNGRFANKLLVLIDGRTVYAPEFSGVYWESQDLMLEDIERIEVIRGPGGTLWGANAVNGVINIITKRAQDTQGGLLTAGGGSEEQGFGSLRYGGKIGGKSYYRVYAKYFDRSGLVDELGFDGNDGQKAAQGGLRMDWELSDRDLLVLQGDIYDSHLRETPTLISPITPFAPIINKSAEYMGGNALSRWTHVFSERSDMALQFYFDRSVRQSSDVGERVDILDLDFQHRFAWSQRQDIVWGGGYRAVLDRFSGANPVTFNPDHRTVNLFSAFVQDEVTVVKDRLRLTLGTKLEHNDYTGFEGQPSGRFLWTPSAHQTIWGAVSRAVRTPARANRNIRVNVSAFTGLAGTPTFVSLFGTPDTRSEELVAYEIGYRSQPVRKFSLDFTGFYNIYDRLIAIDLGQSSFENDPPPPHVLIPLLFLNTMGGETYGLEASANWDINSRWKIHGSYSFLQLHLHHKEPDALNSVANAEGDNPHHQFQLHSYINLPRNFELDASLYRVSRLISQQIPGYTRLDARFGWRAAERLSLSIGLQNLLDNHHPEFSGSLARVIAGEAKRSAYGKLTWRF